MQCLEGIWSHLCFGFSAGRFYFYIDLLRGSPDATLWSRVGSFLVRVFDFENLTFGGFFGRDGEFVVRRGWSLMSCGGYGTERRRGVGRGIGGGGGRRRDGVEPGRLAARHCGENKGKGRSKCD
jgi:hypothetical protein